MLNKKVNWNVSIDPELKKMVQIEAVTLDCKPSHIITKALSDYFKKENKDAKTNR